VGFQNYFKRDQARGIWLNIAVWYPVDAASPGGRAEATPIDYQVRSDPPELDEAGLNARGLLGPTVAASAPNRLLVFSHGFDALNLQSPGLMEALASHGFVVAAPMHSSDSIFRIVDPTTGNILPAGEARVRDVSFVIDHFRERAQHRFDRFYQRVVTEDVGVIGHSVGGGTSVGSAIGWLNAPRDPRVAAIAPVDPWYDPNSLGAPADIQVPMMVLSAGTSGNEYLANYFYQNATNSPAAYHVNLVEATHVQFADVTCRVLDGVRAIPGLTPELVVAMLARLLSLIDPSLVRALDAFLGACLPDAPLPTGEVTRLQSHYIVAFMRRHLLDQTGYDIYLNEAAANTQTTLEFRSRTN
jgi:dienelactone hydrolase